jgi:hypothetical protein
MSEMPNKTMVRQHIQQYVGAVRAIMRQYDYIIKSDHPMPRDPFQ